MAAVLEAIQLLTQLMTLIPQGTALFMQYRADQAALQELYAQGGTVDPTPADWDAADARSKVLEADLDANAARAAGP